MKKTSLLMGAALAGLSFAGAASAKDAKPGKEGECHGINGCKGQGECSGKGNGCAGKNGCKGQGWKKMTKTDCTKAKGKFKPLSMEM